MKYFSNVNRNDSCWNRFGIKYTVWDLFTYFRFLSLFLMQPATESLWIRKLAIREKLNPWNTHEKKSRTQEIPMRKEIFKYFDPRNTHDKKILTHEIPTRNNFGPMKYPREKCLDPGNTHEKNFLTHEIPAKARWHDSTRPTRPKLHATL